MYMYIYIYIYIYIYVYVYVNVYVYVYIIPIIYFGMPACETSEAVLGWLRGTTCPRIFFVFLFAKTGKNQILIDGTRVSYLQSRWATESI